MLLLYRSLAVNAFHCTPLFGHKATIMCLAGVAAGQPNIFSQGGWSRYLRPIAFVASAAFHRHFSGLTARLESRTHAFVLHGSKSPNMVEYNRTPLYFFSCCDFATNCNQ